MTFAGIVYNGKWKHIYLSWTDFWKKELNIIEKKKKITRYL